MIRSMYGGVERIADTPPGCVVILRAASTMIGLPKTGEKLRHIIGIWPDARLRFDGARQHVHEEFVALFH